LYFFRGAMLLFLGSVCASAEEYSHAVPMWEKGTATYFISASIGEHVVDLLVDTGAGYATLNRDIINMLRQDDLAHRSGGIEAVLANGSTLELPVYTITSLNLGGCIIRNVDVAQTPPNARNLLGLSILKEAAPFSFSLEPAELKLSHCDHGSAKGPEVAQDASEPVEASDAL